MFSPDKEEILGMRILIMLPILFGILYSMFKPDYDDLQKLAVKEITKLNVPESVKNNPIIKSLASRNSINPGKVIINDYSVDELVLSLNISKTNAQKIVDERNIRIFSDWEDFKSRIPSLSSKINDFKINGVTLSGE